MSNSAKTVVERMFNAFKNEDINGFVDTVSEDTLWIYHGTQIIPKGEFQGKEGVRKVANNIFSRTEILRFEPQQYIVEGSRVVVLGAAHQRGKRRARELKHKWGKR